MRDKAQGGTLEACLRGLCCGDQGEGGGMRHTLTLSTLTQARADLAELWPLIVDALRAGKRLVLSVRSETRSLAQNALMWSCLTDIARQVEWHGQRLSPEDWKDMASAALKRQTVVPGIEGGFVVLGQRTSDMTIAEMSEMVSFLHAFGDQRGVKWSRTSLGREVPDEVTA
jgi:hypothetical protein